MSSIHLIERENLFRRIDQSSEWESGYWALSEKEVKELVGGTIYFHKKKIELSFYGGEIKGYRLQPDGEYAGRIIFRFVPKAECREVHAGINGWQFEKKIIK